MTTSGAASAVVCSGAAFAVGSSGEACAVVSAGVVCAIVSSDAASTGVSPLPGPAVLSVDGSAAADSSCGNFPREPSTGRFFLWAITGSHIHCMLTRAYCARVAAATLCLVEQLQQRLLIRSARHFDPLGAGGDERGGDLGRQAEMPEREPLFAQAIRLDRGEESLRRAFGKMQHAVDAIVRKRGPRHVGKPRRRRSPGRSGRCGRRSRIAPSSASEIAGAVLAGEIEQRASCGRTSRRHKRPASAATSPSADCTSRKRRRAPPRRCAADGERRHAQEARGRMRDKRARRIRAGEARRRPWPFADRRVEDRLDAQQRRHQRLPAARAQGLRGALAVGLRPGDEEAHVSHRRRNRHRRAA